MSYKNRVSYSQFSMWSVCPHKWKLAYIDKIRDYSANIYMIFGTAMHYTLQMYLTALYSNGAFYAGGLDLLEILRESLAKEYQKEKTHFGENNLLEMEKGEERDKLLDEQFDEIISKKDMIEFYYDGQKIFNWFLKHRTEFFNSKDEELVAIEFPIEETLKPGLDFIAYVDVLIRNKKTGKYRIIDLKVTTKGWGSYKKNDVNTTAQLVLYKAFYANKFNVDPKDITAEFMIFKRKLYEDIPYAQKRVIQFVPASGKPTINKTMIRFDAFVDSCFDEKGNKNIAGVYPKIATESNCRFCPFAERPELCDKKN